jgi:hypothetical protein
MPCAHTMKLIRLTVAASLIAALAACGGGGDGTSPNANALAADTLRIVVNANSRDFSVPVSAQMTAGQLGIDSADKQMNLSVIYTTSGSTTTVTGVAVTVGSDIYQCDARPSVRSPACDTSAITLDTSVVPAPALNVDASKPSSVINVTQIRWN